MVKEIQHCRICGGDNLKPIISLGCQALTGIFPPSVELPITSGPLELVRCDDEHDPNACGLLQLRHSYDRDEMYGLNYGYRSGLNQSMLTHLKSIVSKIQEIAMLNPGDHILDIGSNDGSLLSFYEDRPDIKLIGIDPTGIKFKNYYQPRIQLIPEFFSTAEIQKHFGNQKMRVITSISMFYDLEQPLQFVKEIEGALADDGIWVLEQSYMPTMLEVTAYDTICHEHLEYYGMKQIKWMADKVGLKIISATLNDTNGGSFCLALAKKSSSYPEAVAEIQALFDKEMKMRLNTAAPYAAFTQRVIEHKESLLTFFSQARKEGKKVLGYGASTKGNVILQNCGLTTEDLPYIAEVNSDKFGCFTPGTHIPIISEAQARDMMPDYFFVLPWHFRKGIIEREQAFLNRGGALVFPLPEIELVSNIEENH